MNHYTILEKIDKTKKRNVKLYRGENIETLTKVIIKDYFFRTDDELKIFKKILNFYSLIDTNLDFIMYPLSCEYNISDGWVAYKYISRGDLFDYILESDSANIQEIKTIIKNVAYGIQYLTQNNIVHLDIKLENILLDDDLNIKIIDYETYNIINSGDNKLTKVIGTLNCNPPEIYKLEYHSNSDVWNLGVMIYNLVTKQDLVQIHKKQKVLHMKSILKCIDKLIHDESCRDLLLNIFIEDPEKRFTIDEVINHKWIN
jgi:serine/threonine protein kinase